MSGEQDRKAHDALRDAAAEWLVRVQSDAATDADWNGLSEWLARSPAHRAAYAELEELSFEIEDDAQALRDLLSPSATNLVRLPARHRPRLPAWGWAAAAGLAAAAISPVAWQALEGPPQHFRTTVGETRDLRLADGSDVRLNATTSLDVRLGWRIRRVELGEGEASFDVAKDPGKPFLIKVGDEQVRVVGTAFDIRHYDGLFVLTVSRGVVDAHSANGEGPGARLTAGQQLRRRDGAATFELASVDPATSTAWTTGRLVCNDRPLSDIVAELNRHYRTPVRLGPAAAGRRFSGVIELGDESEALRRLGQFLGLAVHRTDKSFTLG